MNPLVTVDTCARCAGTVGRTIFNSDTFRVVLPSDAEAQVCWWVIEPRRHITSEDMLTDAERGELDAVMRAAVSRCRRDTGATHVSISTPPPFAGAHLSWRVNALTLPDYSIDTTALDADDIDDSVVASDSAQPRAMLTTQSGRRYRTLYRPPSAS